MIKIINKLRSNVSARYDKILMKYRLAIREKAIKQAKSRIILSGQKIAGLGEDELEIIVKEEEDKIIRRYRGVAGVSLLIYLGLR